MKTEYTISLHKANLIAIAMIVPIAVILSIPMFVLHGMSLSELKGTFMPALAFSVFKFAIAITVGVFLHELLHGVGWAIFTKTKWKAISFGFKWEFFTPYCHCNEPLKPWQFFVGAVLPLILLGLAPVTCSFFLGNYFLWLFGLFFTIAAGGDIMAICMLRNVHRGQKVLDHPSELGFIVIDN